MKSPDLEGSSSLAATAAASPTLPPSSPSLTRTPRWGSIRQRFSSIQSRDSLSANVDSVDDGMWDKNDAAFLEEVARSSPLLLPSLDRFESLAPVLEHGIGAAPAHPSSRASNPVRTNEFEDPAQSSFYRRSMQPRPSSSSSSTPSSAASATSALSTPFVSHEDVSGVSPAHAYSKPWPRTMRRMASATVLPDLPEQNRADDFHSFRRPSTASSSRSSAPHTSPQLLSPIGPSPPFASDTFAAAHGLRSPGDRSTAHSSLRSSPSLSCSIHAGSDNVRSALAEYPRSPSIQSASSFTATGFTAGSLDDHSVNPDGRIRAQSSASVSSSTLAPSLSAMDGRSNRSVIGSPLAQTSSFFTSARSSPQASRRNLARPTSVLDGPAARQTSFPYGATELFPASQDLETNDFGSQSTTNARGKRVATSSMRGVPGSPTKKSSTAAAPSHDHATFSSTAAPSDSSGAASNTRKHTKNKSSLVSGLRRLMGKREREARDIAQPDNAMSPTSPLQASLPSEADTAVFRVPNLAQSPRPDDHLATLRSRAMSMDGAPSPGGLNLLGLADDAFGPSIAFEGMRGHHQSSQIDADGWDANVRASPSLARRSPSLDLLRTLGSKIASPLPGASGEDAPAAAPASPRSRTKSIDGLTRPLRDVLSQRPRKDSSSRAASRTSVIEHLSHDEARRLTGSAGPTILRTKRAVEEHRAAYASFPSEIGLPDRAHFDLLQPGNPSTESNGTETRSLSPLMHDNASQAETHRPSRPQRPNDADVIMQSPQDILLPSSNSLPAANAASNNRGGVSSSGSSITSASSAATDSPAALRAPFSFQSQPYRPLSRDLRLDQKAMADRLSSDSANFGTLDGLHRPSLSTGSQNAFSPSRGVPAFKSTPQAASATMLPPARAADAAARGHSSRRSLNSLVSSKPWSSLLGSPILGGGMALGSSSSQRKRVTTTSISRPMSVSTSAFSTDLHDLSSDSADLTLRASDLAGSRARVDSTLSNFSEPLHSHSDLASQARAQPPLLVPPSGPLSVALTPHAATAASSASSHHSHRSHHSQPTHHSHRLAPTSSTSALRQPAFGQLQRPTTGDGYPLDHQDPSALVAGASLARSDGPPSLNRSSSLKALDVRSAEASAFSSIVTSAAAVSTRSHPRPLSSGASYRNSDAGSVLAHRKRPSFGLAIEPAAHSAFDSIPSPLLRTRRGSLALPDGARSGRPFSSSSASAGRTASDSSSRTSLNQSARASAATLSSHHTVASDDKIEVGTVRVDSPAKLAPVQPFQTLSLQSGDSIAALESAMSAVMLQPPSPIHRHSASVPMDEGDSPRQHQEESWRRATGGTLLAAGAGAGADHQNPSEPRSAERRSYMIHSPDEERKPAAPSTDHGRLSQASKDIAFGSIAGMVSKVFEHPFDLVKVRLQTQSADLPPRYAGAFDCFKQTYLQEGIRGLYRGLSMPVLGATLENACLFFTYNQIQSAIRWANGQASSASAAQADADAPLSMPQLGIAAAGAGAVTSLVLTPIELIKCKMQVQMITREQQAPAASAASGVAGAAKNGAAWQLEQQRSLSTSAVRGATGGVPASAQAFKALDGPLTLLRRTVAADGIRGLWLGQTGTLLRETGGGVAWFLAFEGCSRYLIARKRALERRNDVTKKDLSSLELVGAGALAGISYNVVLFPADCVKSTMQTEQEMRAVTQRAVAGQQWKRTGFFDTFKKIYATRGIRGLYAGCGVTCLRSAPSSAIIFLMYNKLEKLSDTYGF